MRLSESDEVWIEQLLRPIALVPIPKEAADGDVVATIWSNRRYADDRQWHIVTAHQVRKARHVYEKVSALLPSDDKED
ncbi:MAG: hypothetical protein QNJ09_18470 [Paracoccaceae bacterium]|nr:hypothetical protein [Paracoccaceae bacterium]